MVVVALVAILAGIAAPSFREMRASQALNAAGSALNESLWLARSEAIKRNTNVRIQFSNAANGWKVITVAGSTELSVQEPIGGVSSGSADFIFNPYGRLATGTGTKLELAATGTTVYHCLSINGTGRVDVEKTKCP